MLYNVPCRCVIAELFMDGRPLFDLSQLLEYYRKEKEATEATLKKIPDRFIRVSKEAPSCTWIHFIDGFGIWQYTCVVRYGKGRQV